MELNQKVYLQQKDLPGYIAWEFDILENITRYNN